MIVCALATTVTPKSSARPQLRELIAFTFRAVSEIHAYTRVTSRQMFSEASAESAKMRTQRAIVAAHARSARSSTRSMKSTRECSEPPTNDVLRTRCARAGLRRRSVCRLWAPLARTDAAPPRHKIQWNTEAAGGTASCSLVSEGNALSPRASGVLPLTVCRPIEGRRAILRSLADASGS